ncbi:probable LRR receptor-like serine/threonine-protein kinase At1g56140 [Rosa rugosa]|uniref:probable LRR receptor-like serine/threonine-protein kinase At1g56140 n=1 Tax=Rosa rugosa TaxID=74645 RepID=UPI002B415E8D|nr:probable LRR receptor-like serine/threonine-protein kinase At1g56140 [Rosa rugosa]
MGGGAGEYGWQPPRRGCLKLNYDGAASDSSNRYGVGFVVSDKAIIICWCLLRSYLDSSGVSGEIPSTFANLQSLQTLWASDVELSGSIPNFIGNWSKLTSLRFQGNSFEGPIPSALSNLTSLTELYITDLSTTNGSSSLGFIKDMKSLSVLVLRNNNISDSIPSNIGEYQSLSQLDLSFNNLTGQIPDSLFNLSSLSILFLGNNKLNGTLPESKSSSLLNVKRQQKAEKIWSFRSPVQNQTPSSSSGSNSRILRLFGVNLECQQQDDESEPSTPDGSSLSSQGPTHHQFYPNPTHAYYGDHKL